jgi:hypothetical protein
MRSATSATDTGCAERAPFRTGRHPVQSETTIRLEQKLHRPTSERPPALHRYERTVAIAINGLGKKCGAPQ